MAGENVTPTDLRSRPIRFGRAARIQTKRFWHRIRRSAVVRAVGSHCNVEHRPTAWTLAAAAGSAAVILMIVWQITNLPETSYSANENTVRAASGEVRVPRPSGKTAAVKKAPAIVARHDPFSDTSNEGSTRRPPVKSAEKPVFPIADTVQKSEPNVTVINGPRLVLEISRPPPAFSTSDTEHFLETSLENRPSNGNQPGPAVVITETKSPGESRNRIGDGWVRFPAVGNPAAVIPTGRGGIETSASSSRPISVRGSASANSSWTVDSARLRCEIIAPASVVAETSLVIQFRITNIGPVAATGVKLHIDLPASLPYRIGRRLEHAIGRIEAGATQVARLTTRGTKAGIATVSARVIADGGIESRGERRVKIITAR